MKTQIQVPDARLALWGAIGMFASVNAATVPFPNGNFEIPDGANWDKTSFAGNQVISFPVTGGNTGGYGSIASNELTGYAVLVTNGGAPYPLASLGLVAGKTYTFSYDMITSVAGPNKGGVKIESWSSSARISDSDNQRVTSASTAWATYSYAYTINPTATHIKVVPLWTPGETVGFDNVRVDNTPIVAPPVVPVIPNSGFEIQPPADTRWSFFGDGFGLQYLPTGGNPDGNVVINGTTPGNYGVLVANNNIPQTLASLGLTAGETYTFQQDMKLISGSALGGLKVEFVPGFSGERFPTAADIIALPNPVSQWNTYSFQITIPPTCTQIQVVPLGKQGSVVAYDNVRILLPPPVTAQIQKGTGVSWNATSPVNFYQAQESPTGLPGSFTNLGPKITGNAVNTAFAALPAPFYQVLETTPDLFANAVLNPGFETAEFSATPADNWITLVAVNGGTATTPESYTGGILPNGGAKMLKLESVTPSTGPVTPPDLNIRSENFNITGGTSYTYSFYAANPVKIGGANPQYYYEFLNEFGGAIGITFQSFESVGTAWTKVEKTFTAPAAATAMRVGWIQALGAGNGWQWVTLIDDVSLPTPSAPGTTTVIPATTAPGVQVSWNSKTGKTYQVESSNNLTSWDNFGSPMAGSGNILSVADLIGPGSKFYRVQETP